MDERPNLYDLTAEVIPPAATAHAQHVENIKFLLDRFTGVDAGAYNEACIAIDRFAGSSLRLSVAERDALVAAVAAFEAEALQNAEYVMADEVIQFATQGMVVLIDYWCAEDRTRAAIRRDGNVEEHRDAVRAFRHLLDGQTLVDALEVSRSCRRDAMRDAA